MNHIAIMKKSWGLLPKVLSGEKRWESRWYKSRYAPWGRIKSGDTVYFQDSGEPVTVKAKVGEVKEFSELSSDIRKKIVDKYAVSGGLGIEDKEWFLDLVSDKNYCILFSVEDVQRITPFFIDKSGYGAMAAWLCVDDIAEIKAKS